MATDTAFSRIADIDASYVNFSAQLAVLAARTPLGSARRGRSRRLMDRASELCAANQRPNHIWLTTLYFALSGVGASDNPGAVHYLPYCQ